MIRNLYSCCCLLSLLTLLTGGLYPLVITVAARLVFPHQANGSLIVENGRVIGSSLVGQEFSKPEYFWSRPSAAAYNAAASSGSNLSPTNPAHLEAVAGRVRQLNGAPEAPVPVDLATASGSGLDPHISPAAAFFQVSRVAQSRGMPEAKLRDLVAESVESRTFGLLGEHRVNVLQLNRALGALNAVK